MCELSDWFVERTLYAINGQQAQSDVSIKHFLILHHQLAPLYAAEKMADQVYCSFQKLPIWSKVQAKEGLNIFTHLRTDRVVALRNKVHQKQQ